MAGEKKLISALRVFVEDIVDDRLAELEEEDEDYDEDEEGDDEGEGEGEEGDDEEEWVEELGEGQSLDEAPMPNDLRPLYKDEIAKHNQTTQPPPPPPPPPQDEFERGVMKEAERNARLAKTEPKKRGRPKKGGGVKIVAKPKPQPKRNINPDDVPEPPPMKGARLPDEEVYYDDV